MAGGGPSVDEDGAVFSEINVTPLVDVMLVLLVIMMVTAPMLSEPASIVIDLPSGKTGEATAQQSRSHTLTVGKGGVMQMDGATFNLTDLGPRLVEAVKTQPDLEVGLAADRGVEYGTIIQVLDTIRLAGVTRFALQMDQEEAVALQNALQGGAPASVVGGPAQAPAPAGAEGGAPAPAAPAAPGGAAPVAPAPGGP